MRVILLSVLLAAALSSHYTAPGKNPLGRATRLTVTSQRGVVREVVRAGSYAYMRVEDGAQARWVVVMGRGAAVGAQITLTLWASYPTFRSPRLGRSFTPLYLATM